MTATRRVTIASPLRHYTGGRNEVRAAGTTLAEVLHDLEHQFPGLRFRMVDEQQQLRPHMRVFDGSMELRALDTPLSPGGDLHIVQALSGG